MNLAVKFDCEPFFDAVEVEDILSNAVLPAKLSPGELRPF
jgi:hypothetical protein